MVHEKLVQHQYDMKKLFLLLMVGTLVTTTWAEKVKFTINGIAPKGATAIEVENINQERTIKTLKVVDGRFSFSGTLPDDTYLRFVDKNSHAFNYVITDGTAITLDMVNDCVSGSPLSERLYAAAHSLGNDLAAYYQCEDRLRNANHSDSLSVLRARRDAQLHTFLNSLRKVVEENAGNCMPVYLLVTNRNLIPYEDLVAYSESGAVYAKHPFFKVVKSHIEHQDAILALIGQPFKDANLKTGTGMTVKLSDYIGKGHYVLVDFWASWCRPCMGEMPSLKEAYATYHEKGLEVLGVSLDHDRSAWIGAVSRLGMLWPQFCDYKRYQGDAAVKYDLHAIPWNFLCDGNGNIVAVGLRGLKLQDKLREIYGF